MNVSHAQLSLRTKDWWREISWLGIGGWMDDVLFINILIITLVWRCFSPFSIFLSFLSVSSLAALMSCCTWCLPWCCKLDRVVSSGRSPSFRAGGGASLAVRDPIPGTSQQAVSPPTSRSFLGRFGIRKPSLLSLSSATSNVSGAPVSPHTYENRTFSLDDLLRPSRSMRSKWWNFSLFSYHHVEVPSRQSQSFGGKRWNLFMSIKNSPKISNEGIIIRIRQDEWRGPHANPIQFMQCRKRMNTALILLIWQELQVPTEEETILSRSVVTRPRNSRSSSNSFPPEVALWTENPNPSLQSPH